MANRYNNVSQKDNNDESMKKLHQNNAHIVFTSLVAGAIAGALAKTAIAPLDRTKINFQIRNTPYTLEKAVNFIRDTYRKEGFLALWRGNSATMARIVPYAAIQFTAHEQWKRLIIGDNSNPRPVLRVVCGSLAGLTSQAFTYPLDLARARMAVTHKDEYSSLIQVFKKIYKEEGMKTFYRGFVPTLLGVIPYAGISFCTYDTLKKLYHEKADTQTFKVPQPIVSLGIGAIAGMLGQSSSYPLDIVRRRMQTSKFTDPHYKTILGTLKKVYREEGIKNGFFKGLSMNWIKGPIAVGISFATYDFFKDTLRKILAALYHS